MSSKDLIVLAARPLGISLPSRLSILYSARFKSYNANVRHSPSFIEFRLSAAWREVDDEIVVGVLQHLLIKIFRLKTSTLNTQLYDEFLKQLSHHTVPHNVDEFLKMRFDLLNKQYFFSMMDTPNLEWGRASLQRLGSYHYATDTIRVSTVLRERVELLDYVLFHEMLHKKHKFSSSNGSCRHHTKEFREEEATFHVPDAESQLTAFVALKRREKKSRPVKKLPLWNRLFR